MSKIKTRINSLKQDQHAVKLFKGGGLVLLWKVLGALSGFVIMKVITDKYGLTAVGFYEFCITILTISAVVVKLGLDGASVKFTSEYLVKKTFGKIKGLYIQSSWAIVLVSIIVCIGLFLLSRYLDPNLPAHP